MQNTVVSEKFLASAEVIEALTEFVESEELKKSSLDSIVFCRSTILQNLKIIINSIIDQQSSVTNFEHAFKKC